MKLALVYDRINKWGGAERVLLALHEIWPDAPIFTAVYDSKRAAWARVFDIQTSFIQKIPFAKNCHELFPWLTPIAFETFNFDAYDVVISVTSAEAKSVITKPDTLHICYCLTPTRYLWSGYEDYIKNPGFGKLGRLGRSVLKHMAPTLQRWDVISASRPDYYIAISNHVSGRVKKYYRRNVEAVIYPPAGWVGPPVTLQGRAFKVCQGWDLDDYFLVVSRLVGYKRIDIIIDAFNKLGWPITIVGDGVAKGDLKRHSQKNITFISSYLTDEELARYYESCRALVIAADEDFGLAAAEAHSYGKPVVAFGDSGVREIVIDGQTGVLFHKQSTAALMEALKRFEKMTFDPKVCQKQADHFSKEKFKSKMSAVIKKIAQEYFI